MSEQETQNKILAAMDFVRRCGAKSAQIRYSDDEKPVIWIAVATFDDMNQFGIDSGFEVDASGTPLGAILRLCERLVDGNMCLHCKRPAGFEPNSLLTMPFNKKICWYQYDPELRIFRRGCE